MIFDLAWRCWIFPVLLLAVWILLWRVRAGRRLRLWFAGLAPVGAVAGIVLGLIVVLGSESDGPERTCPGCPSGAAHWAVSLNSISDVGLLILVNAVFALVLAVPLLIITLLVELTRAPRRDSRPVQPGVK